MVIRGSDGSLYWQDLNTGLMEPYTGQDGASAASPGADEGAQRLAAGLGDGGAAPSGPGTPQPAPPPEPFDPNKHAITGVTKLPGGTQYRYTDTNGVTQVAFIPGTTGSGTGTASAAVQAKSAAQNAALTEQQRQFNEKMGMDKAQFNEQYALDQGKTLLGLGSRPDTLIKYLYAIRGQQTPQAINGTTTNLPGFQNVVGQPNPGAVAAPVAAPAAATPTQAPRLAPLPTLSGQDLTGMIGTPQTATAQVNALRSSNNPTPFPYTAPTSTAPYGTSVGGTPLTSDTKAFFDHLAGMGVFAPPPSPATTTAAPPSTVPPPTAMAHGGVIPEPVMGVGMRSNPHLFAALAQAPGHKYTFGEPDAQHPQGAPERVVPNADKGAPARAGTPTLTGRGYAMGGTIGYDPSTPPISANVFNPPDLSSIVARGYNSSPNTPLFPQVGIATNGGQSLIPSAQRYNSLLPSEQSLYQGTLQDEFGVNPADTIKLSQQLAPQVSGLHTPRFSN